MLEFKLKSIRKFHSWIWLRVISCWANIASTAINRFQHDHNHFHSLIIIVSSHQFSSLCSTFHFLLLLLLILFFFSAALSQPRTSSPIPSPSLVLCCARGLPDFRVHTPPSKKGLFWKVQGTFLTLAISGHPICQPWLTNPHSQIRIDNPSACFVSQTSLWRKQKNTLESWYSRNYKLTEEVDPLRRSCATHCFLSSTTLCLGAQARCCETPLTSPHSHSHCSRNGELSGKGRQDVWPPHCGDRVPPVVAHVK